MTRGFDADEIAKMGRFPPERIRDWRYRGLLEGWGRSQGNRWYYDEFDSLALGCAWVLTSKHKMEIGGALAGVKMGRAILIAYFLEGTEHDNDMLARIRSSDDVVCVWHNGKKEPPHDWSAAWLSLNRFAKELRAKDDSAPSIALPLCALVHDLDKGFRSALLTEHDNVDLIVKTRLKEDEEQRRKADKRRDGK